MYKQRLLRKLILAFAFLGFMLILINNNEVLRLVFSTKVWAHKTNTPEKAKKKAARYSGIEIDVVFNENSNKFDVFHPPFNGYKCLLDEILIITTQNKELIYWIDFKNLNKKNYLAALNELNKLALKYDFQQEQIIVESSNLKCLVPFQENGNKTSYYLPQKLSLVSSYEVNNKIGRIKKYIEEYNPSYISTNFTDYEIVKEHFPNHKKLFWFTVYGDLNRLKTRFTLYKILRDSSVNSLLIPD